MDIIEMSNNIKEIPMIMVLLKELLQISEAKSTIKRWMSTNELSSYLSFSTSKINKMLDVEFVEGIHFYKRENRNLFDIQAIDMWVLNTPINNNDYRGTDTVIQDVLSSINTKEV